MEPCLKWHKHTQELLKKLKTRLGALATLKDILPDKSKKSLAEGIFISLLCYCLPLYGVCDKKSIESLQVMQNKAAQLVTSMLAWTSRKKLFEQLNWFSVRQLLFYHTALTTYRIRKSKEPEYLYNKMS